MFVERVMPGACREGKAWGGGCVGSVGGGVRLAVSTVQGWAGGNEDVA